MRYSDTHKEETRRKVVRAAAAAIRAKGPEGVGVAEIMAEVGLTQVGFHQIGQLQIRFVQPRLLETGFRSIDFGEVGLPEIGMR